MYFLYQQGDKDVVAWYQQRRNVLVKAFIFGKPISNDTIFYANYHLRCVSEIDTHLIVEHFVGYRHFWHLFYDLLRFECWYLQAKHTQSIKDIERKITFCNSLKDNNIQ